MVVLDLGLPDITGRDVLTRVRRAASRIKVVIFSGAEPEDRAWWDANAEGYVLKDADIDYLVALLESVARPAARSPTRCSTCPRTSAASARPAASCGRSSTQWDLLPLLDDALLVVSELAANAITHAALRLPGPADLVVALAADRGARRRRRGPRSRSRRARPTSTAVVC